MRIFILLYFSLSFFLTSQNLPEHYYFSSNNQQFLRGNMDITDGFYSELSVDTIFLYFDQEDYWEQLHDNYCDKINISATLTYNNETFWDVGVRFKGQTSYANTNGDNGGGGPGGGGPGGGGPGGGGPGGSVDTDKKSFNIELDWINDQDIDGYETLNLNNCYQDPSFLREFLFEKLSRKYIPATKVNFIQLMINDENWGIYPNVQQLDKKHAGEWFFDNECTRWRAEDPSLQAPGCSQPTGLGPGGGGGGPQFGAGTSSLNYLGEDTVNYLDHYTLKKSYVENPWDALVSACKVVDDVSQVDELEVYNFINEHLDLDATLWHLADEIIFSDDDSYINKGGMDYYVYYDIYNERILPIEYDGNTVFKNANWNPFRNEDDSDFALLNKLLSIDEFRQRYLAHFRTILANSMDSNYIEGLINQYANFIDSYVSNDPQKIYTYNEFLSEINDLKNYFSDRYSFLSANFEVSQIGLEIENVEYFVGSSLFAQPNSSNEVLVTVSLNSNNPEIVNLYYGTGLTGRFEKIPMNYSVASNNYSITLPPQAGGEYVRFYIESVNSNGTRAYSPQGAEHDVYIYQVKPEGLVYLDSDIVINEIMASNDMVAEDGFGEYDDWIEIYNKGAVSVNLEGYHLSDDILELEKYTFPSITLNPDEYLIVWADDDEEDQGNMHATFKLSSAGEQVYLSDSNLNILDEVVFAEQQTDMGYARVPNGTGDFVIQFPTFFFNNDQSSSQMEHYNNQRELIYSIDVLGRRHVLKGFILDVYNDGSVDKRLLLE